MKMTPIVNDAYERKDKNYVYFEKVEEKLQ